MTSTTAPSPDVSSPLQLASPQTSGATQVVAISACHAVNDTYASFLSPLLPAFIANLALTKAEAGLLTVFYQGPSVLQPVIGHLADRRGLRFLIISAPAVTGAMMSLLGLAPTYGALALLLMVAGLSSAGLHAVGSAEVGHLSARRLGRGLSIWMIGGELGSALGAVLVVSAVAVLGLRGTPWLMVGGFAASAVAYWALRGLPARQMQAHGDLRIGPALAAMRPVLAPVAIIVVLRSFVEAAATTYLPTFLTSEGVDLWSAGVALTIVEIAGVGGALAGGLWSDRAGRRPVLAVSLLASPLCLILFLLAGGPARLAVLAMLGFTTFAFMPVVLAIVQGAFPENRALASGIYMAAAFALRSVVVVIVGILGDRLGLRAAFYVSACMSLLALPVVLFLPASCDG